MTIALFVFLASALQVTEGICPHLAGDLELWSESSTWGAQGLPTVNSDVDISKPILVDDLAVSQYNCINVRSGGRLVFSPDHNPNLRVHCILIENGGEMHMGSEDCRFNGSVDITLLGEHGDMNVAGFGEKFIGVKQGGVLELHGEEKIGWTKLTQTAPKFDYALGQFFRHRELSGIDNRAGMYIYHFNRTGGMVDSIFRRLDRRTQAQQDANIAELVSFLNNIPNNDVFALGTQREITAQNNSNLETALTSVAGPNRFDEYELHAAYVMIGVKGNQDSTMEDLQFNSGNTLDQVEAMTELIIGNIQYLVFTNNSKSDSKSKVDFVTRNTDYSKPILSVVDDVKSVWKPGDSIVIASTDYKYNQAEVVTLEECQECDDNQIKLSRPLFYTHFGEIYKGVDMRAEVGMLTRKIHIKGEIAPGKFNGGHVKFLIGFKSVRVQGIELSSMGDPEILGRYPLHYHMCQNLLDDVYESRSYIRQNSIHDTFRCVTIHGTHNALLVGNTCYNTIGHAYFLEDGGEKGTTLYGNLALNQRRWTGAVRVPPMSNPTGAIPTDKSKGPVSFWLTNPRTKVINNAAGGGDGVGYWFVYPDKPTGPSRALNFMQPEESKHTEILLFENNVAHSYMKAGLFIDNIEQDDLTVSGYNEYEPWENPLVKSNHVPFYITRLTAYKNIQQNTWIRGSWAVVQYSSEEKVHHHFENNIVLGDTMNIGEPANMRDDNGQWVPYTERSLPNPSKPWLPRCGFTFFQGPAELKNTWFDDFYNNDLYNVGAICFRRCNIQSKSVLNLVDNVQFGFDDSASAGNRVFDGNENVRGFCSRDGDNTNGFMDLESTTIGSGYRVMRPLPFHLNANCFNRTNWNMAYCRNYYAQVEISYTISTKKSDDHQVTVMRGDDPYATFVTDEASSMRFFAIADGTTNYLLWFSNIDVPDSITIKGHGVTRSHPVRVAICVPTDASIIPRYRLAGKNIQSQAVSTLAEIDADTEGGKYLYDTTVGVVITKLNHPDDFSADDRENFYECPGKKCTDFRITLNGGTRSQRDCSEMYKSTYGDADKGSSAEDTEVIPAHLGGPPAGLGAGITYPFPPYEEEEE